MGGRLHLGGRLGFVALSGREGTIKRAANIFRMCFPWTSRSSCMIDNDDQTSHNIHPLAKVNQEWNKSQPPGSPPIDTKYEKPEFIPVKCNIHPWMHGYFVVLKTSHYADQREDGSTKSRVPPGKYTVSRRGKSNTEQKHKR